MNVINYCSLLLFCRLWGIPTCQVVRDINPTCQDSVSYQAGECEGPMRAKGPHQTPGLPGATWSSVSQAVPDYATGCKKASLYQQYSWSNKRYHLHEFLPFTYLPDHHSNNITSTLLVAEHQASKHKICIYRILVIQHFSGLAIHLGLQLPSCLVHSFYPDLMLPHSLRPGPSY